jgi:hypothetical protein
VKIKTYHFAAKIDVGGRISALCYRRPRAINLASQQSWTIRRGAVNCCKCLKLLSAADGPKEQP